MGRAIDLSRRAKKSSPHNKKKMAEKNPDKSYGWHTAQHFNDYIERVVGDYGQELEKRKFDDKDETDYYDSLEFCADLVWNEYQVKQVESHPREDTALVNVDVLDTVLLSLHPESKVKEASDISERTREGLKELHCFNALIHLDKVTKAEMEHLLESLPNTYASQLALMAWFVTLASKMTGKKIPGVGMAPGGEINKPEEEVEEHLQHFLAIADAMAKNKNWSFLAQSSILKEMLADLHVIAEGKTDAGNKTPPNFNSTMGDETEYIKLKVVGQDSN